MKIKQGRDPHRVKKIRFLDAPEPPELLLARERGNVVRREHANHLAHFLVVVSIAVSIKVLFVPVEGAGCAIDNEDGARFLGSRPVVGRQDLGGDDRHVRGGRFVENLESRRGRIGDHVAGVLLRGRCDRPGSRSQRA